MTSHAQGAKVDPEGPGNQPQSLFLPAGSKAGPGLSFSADQLHFRPSQKKIILKGRVSLSSGELVLKARTLEVQLDAKGKPTLLMAKGKVSFKMGKSRGSAREARLLTLKRQISLIGEVRLKLAEMELDLTGDRMQMDLVSGRVSVQSARARFRHGP